MTAAFPSSSKIWTGGLFKFLGSGIKYRKILFIKIQLYAIALYAEEGPAVREFARLQNEGFFKDYSTQTLCDALVEGRFQKYLQIQLLRDVTYSQFTDEIGRDLQPRLAKAGAPDQWKHFEDYFKDKSLNKYSNLLGLIDEHGILEGGLFPPDVTDFQQVEASLHFQDSTFGKAILDVYLGPGGIVPDAKQQWAAGAKTLLPAIS